MNMKSILLATTAVFTLSAAAFAADKESYQSNTSIEKNSNGDYTEKSKTMKTDMDGTTNSYEKNLNIANDANGNSDKSKMTETVTDPKGLGNKHTVTVKDTETTKGGNVTTTHEKTVDGKNTEGTKDSYKTSTKTQKDSDGNYAKKDITTNTDAEGTTTSFEKNATVAVDANGNVDKSTTKTSNTEQTKDGIVSTAHSVVVDGKTVDSKSETGPKN